MKFFATKSMAWTPGSLSVEKKIAQRRKGNFPLRLCVFARIFFVVKKYQTKTYRPESNLGLSDLDLLKTFLPLSIPLRIFFLCSSGK